MKSPGESIRNQFPLLERSGTSGHPICYLDNAATAPKPLEVIQAVTKVLSRFTANIHRGVHLLGDEATEIFEEARNKVARFIGSQAHEVVFTKNTTEALNLVAGCWPQRGRIITSHGEHHSNLLPWEGDIVRLTPKVNGKYNREALEGELKKGGVSLVSLSHVSNVSGARIPIREMADLCHAHGAVLVVDAAQSIPHKKIDVVKMDCDFLAFSGHKLGAPTGVGVLYGKAEHLARLTPYHRGGAAVDEVHMDRIVPKSPPWKFEAGTPAIEAVVGLGKAIDFLSELGMESVDNHHQNLTLYALGQIKKTLPGARILGPDDHTRSGPVSMTFPGISSHNLARGLSNGYSICARSGFHCAQPLHEALNSPATLRLSFFCHNTQTEIDTAIHALEELVSLTR